MKIIISFVISIVLAITLSTAFATPKALAIGDGGAQGGVRDAKGAGVPTNFANGDNSLIRNIINILLYAIGVLSVIMLIIGGFRYVISGGQKDSVTAAKNTILYAIVGLLVAIFAYAIVQFILSAVVNGNSSTNV